MPARMTSVDQFKRNLWALRKRAGPGAELLIFYRDVSKAFTRFPQAAGEMFLSVFQFDGHLHISLRSLFGLRSPGYICSAASTAVSEATNADYTAEEIMAFSAAYVDDFGGGTVKHDAPVAEERLDTHMSKSGLPQELIKRRVSAPIGPYIGLVWDPALMRCSLPPEKLEKTRRAAQRVAGARRMQAGELAEVLGIVEYAASVVPILGAFITEVRDCTRGAAPRAWVTITQDARDEAEIWLNILDIHDGDHFIPESDREADCPTVLSDASTSNGLGFFSPEAGIYFSMPLDGALAATDGVTSKPIINKLEQLASFLGFLAVAYDGARLLQKTRAVRIFTDNTASEGATNRLRSTSRAMASYTRCFASHAASLDILPRCVHVPGKTHVQADLLSRGEVPLEFLSPGWRRVSITTATLTELLTRRDPWNVDVVFSCAGATPDDPPTELRAPHRTAALGKSRLGASLEAAARL